MISGKKVLAIIPARAGSKRVVNKNIRDLGGIPLIAWSLKDLQESKYIDHSYVSTDSTAIQEIAKKYDVDSTPLRPEELASDLASSVDVIVEAIKQKPGFDIIVLLQPTSPFRKIVDIDKALELYIEKKANSVVSVCPSETHPSWVASINSTLSLDPIIEKLQAKRSQDLEKHYQLNGAIYVTDIPSLLQKKTLFIPHETYAYIMSRLDSVDIDTEEDLMVAKALVSMSSGFRMI